jgi:uncharacterized membrane protein
MTTTYNEIAGKSLNRLAGLSDGVFAVAMTLLVLDLRAPAASAVHSEHDLIAALLGLAPNIATYLMSFLTLGIFWVGQQAGLNFMARSTRDFTWLHIAFLVAVTLLPFSTGLLAAFPEYRTALLIYWGNFVLLGGLLYAGLLYAKRTGLIKPDVSPDLLRAIDRRIQIGQGLYALGAALCVFNTWFSIAFLVAVQLNYAVAPRIKPLSSL